MSEMIPRHANTQRLLSQELLDRAHAHAPKADATRDLDRDVLAAIKASPLNRALISREFGGTGGSWAEAGRAIAALGEVCPATAWVTYNHLVIQYRMVRELGRVEPDRTKRLVEAGDWVAQCDSFAPTAVRDGEEYMVAGISRFGSGAIYADRICGTMKVEGPAPEAPQHAVPFHARYTVYEPNQPGLRIERTWDGVGLRASATDTLHYEKVRIPAERTLLVPESVPAAGRRQVLSPALSETYMGTGTTFVACATVGAATRLVRLVAEDLGTRRLSDGTLGADKPLIRANLARALQTLLLATQAVQNTLTEVDRRHERGELADVHTSARMHLSAMGVVESATDAARQAFRLLGASGLREGPAERFMRDIQAMSVHVACQPSPWHDFFGGAAFGSMDMLPRFF